jgi:predicted Rossmann-fold nucleotide-binding protein
VTPYLAFQFHYFALRKMHFLMRARAVAVFPGGFGTFDEMFELLTLIQTGKMKRIPVLLFGKEFWTRVIDFGALAREGVISPSGPRADHLVRDGAEDALGAEHRRASTASRTSRALDHPTSPVIWKRSRGA